MALAAATVWEVRTDGNDANGGGFVTGASGTDYSQQAAAQIAYTDLVIDAVTNTNVTSAAFPFTAAEVGNILNVTGGTGFTTGWYQVVSVAAAVATLDRAVGTTGSTGGTGNLGGAHLTPATTINSRAVASNTTYVKSGTYSGTTTITPLAGATAAPTRIIGYQTTRGDLDGAVAFTNHPILQINNSTNRVLSTANNYLVARNLIFDGGGGAAKSDFSVLLTGGTYFHFENCKFTGFTRGGLLNNAGTVVRVIRCWALGGVAGADVGAFQSSTGVITFIACVANANTYPGFMIANAGYLIGCLSFNHTSANGDGFRLNGNSLILVGCVASGNAAHGLNLTATASADGPSAYNNIFSGNGGYGIRSAASNWPEMAMDYNAFYNNTSGARYQVPAGAHDVTLTGDPFTNAAGNDFSLNNVAGAGAACRNAGFPGALPGLATPLGYADIGVYRHQDPAQGPVFRGATL